MDYKEVFGFISSLWTTKILTVQGVKLAFGNLFLCLVILVLANRMAKLITRWIAKKFLLKIGLDRSIMNVYQTFIYYAALAGIVLFGLTMGGIPLTIFTVIGGALAIGVGFGSQNIVNNFISGIIIMIERPLKIGDVVEIDGVAGTVQSIGTRSTRLKTVDAKTYIIPNSAFLEKNLLNSTLNDPVIRTEINVGVAYGSDLNLVKQICHKVISENRFIQKTPEIKIIFDEFGASSLDFKLFFWVNLDEVDTVMEVRSDIRYRLDEEFKKANIEIAFPQRDLNIRSSSPIQVIMKS